MANTIAYHLKPALEMEIIAIAKECGIRKLMLFGSRAKGTNRERSDIDLAVWGGDPDEFYARIEEETHTLLMFDVVAMDLGISDVLKCEIDEEGIVLYEEI